MARARNIKPALFDNDQLAEIEPLGRLLFIGLWTIADYKGDLVYREKRIKAQLLPYDNCDVKNIMINLDKSGFVRFYSDGEQVYVNITNFSKHQNPHKNERAKGSVIPEFTESMAQVVDLLTLTINRDKNGTDTDNGEVNRADSLSLIPDSLSLIPDSPPETVVVAKAPKFNFKSELLALGVDGDILEDWLTVRKKKKASNTKTAFNGLISEVTKSGLMVNDAIEYAASKSWSGFKADWYFNENPINTVKQYSDTTAKNLKNLEGEW
mgnify:FL=1